jgi:hypothetical protein
MSAASRQFLARGAGPGGVPRGGFLLDKNFFPPLGQVFASKNSSGYPNYNGKAQAVKKEERQKGKGRGKAGQTQGQSQK